MPKRKRIKFKKLIRNNRIRNQEIIKKEGCAKHPSSEDNTELNKLKDYFIVPSDYKTIIVVIYYFRTSHLPKK